MGTCSNSSPNSLGLGSRGRRGFMQELMSECATDGGDEGGQAQGGKGVVQLVTMQTCNQGTF